MNFLPENSNFEDILDGDTISNSQPISLPSSQNTEVVDILEEVDDLYHSPNVRPSKHTGQKGVFRSTEEIRMWKDLLTHDSSDIIECLSQFTDKSMVVCAPTGSGKTVVFEMAIVQLLMNIEDQKYTEDFKIIYMAPVKALCTERLTEWYPKFTKLGLLCIEVTGDTDVEFPQLKPYRVIITTPEKWDMLTRRWKDYRGLVEVVKLFLIDEVHILNDNTRGPVLEAVVSRMKTIESSVQSAHRIELLQKQYRGNQSKEHVTTTSPRIRFVAVSATVSNPEDVATWLGTADKPAVYYKFGDECRPVKLMRVVEGYPCPQGTSIFKFDIILNYKLWPIIQKYHNGKPTLIFCNTRKSVALTAETLSREITINFNPEQKAKLMALASTLKTKKLQALILNGVGCHHAGLLYEERMNIEHAFRNRDLPILITTTTLAMGVNLPAHLVIVKNTQQYVNGAYQEYSISTILQMVGRAGRPQFDTEATAVIMTRVADKARYQALVEGTEPLQSFLHKRLAENLNSEAALGTVTDVAQCVQWVNSTFLSVRAAKDPRRYLGLPQAAPANEISKKIEALCVKAMNGLASSGLITMDEASCIESTEAGKLMSLYYLDLETMKLIMKIEGSETLDGLLWLICESHELSDMHLRMDERRSLNTLNRSNTAATIRFPMKGKINSRQMKLNCVIQAVLGCLPIPDPSLNQEAMKIMRIALRVCKCLVAYTTRPTLVSQQPKAFSAVLNSIVLTKCLTANLWENSSYVSKQLRGIGPAFSMLLASAGKTNFLLLEESHPRDLERIMNKGPPAGNVLRKQIGLLPKYQLVITPIDRDRVLIQLTLLNQAHLSENLEHFTAGGNHKSYIIVGDSENCLLHLTSFKDTDLINIYDGSITFEVTRKHNQEHKVIAHCVSSSFAGIDVQTEYLFIEVGPFYHKSTDDSPKVFKNISIPINTAEQKAVDRKRKINKSSEVGCFSGKMKRGNNLIENFKCLKESFGKNNKEMLGNVNKTTEMSNKTSPNLTRTEFRIINESFDPLVFKDLLNTKDHLATRSNDDSLNKEDVYLKEEVRVNNILSKIEEEISKTNAKSEQLKDLQQIFVPLNQNKKDIGIYNRHSLTKRTDKRHIKCNFDVIDVLEKRINSNEENELIFSNDNIDGFTNTVKFKIDKYLQNTENSIIGHKDINDVLQIENEGALNSKIDSKAQSDIVVDELITDDPHGQNHSFVNHSKNNINEITILKPNISEESNKSSWKDLCHNNVLVNDKYDDCKNITECSDPSNSTRHSTVFVSSYDNNYLTKVLPLSLPVNINDEESETIKNQNDNMKMNNPLNRLNAYESDSGINITHDKTNERQDILYTNYSQETNDQCFTNSNGSVQKLSQSLENNTLSSEHTKQAETTFDTEDNAVLSNCNSKNKVHETSKFAIRRSSLVDPIFDNIIKQKSRCESPKIIHKPFLKNLRENKSDFQRNSPIAQDSNLKNLDLCFTASTKRIDPPIYNKEDVARTVKYCFHASKFNISTENSNEHTVKIISKLKIDLDVTKIIVKKDEKRDTFETVANESETRYSNIKIEPEPKCLEMDINIRSPLILQNIGKTDSNNVNLVNDSKAMESTISNRSIQEEIPNQIGKKNNNTVKDILKKYSLLMTKCITPNIAAVPVTKQVNNITMPPVDKQKRRYNINDIINLKADLPIENIGRDFNLIKFKNKVVEESENEIIQDDYLSDDSLSSNISTNTSELNLPATAPLQTEFSNEIDKDCKLDDSMLSGNRNILEPTNMTLNLNKTLLNPKALLECYNDNIPDDVIAPPPEFANITNLSSHINSTAYTPSSPDYDPEIHYYDILNKSSELEISSPIDGGLTSSKETETLSLSPEDNLQDHTTSFLFQNRVNDRRVTQNNPYDIQALYSNRNNTLGEYKYKRKNILKLKK